MFGLDSRQLASDSFCFQRSLEEFCISDVIFKVQNSERRIHRAYRFLTLPGGGSLITAQNTPSSFTAFTKSWKSTGFVT